MIDLGPHGLEALGFALGWGLVVFTAIVGVGAIYNAVRISRDKH